MMAHILCALVVAVGSCTWLCCVGIGMHALVVGLVILPAVIDLKVLDA